VVSGGEVIVCVAAGCPVTVMGEADVMVIMIVEGWSDSVMTMVDSCVCKRVSVRTTELITVVADPSAPEFPPSTATTEYDAGSLRSW
jgi:hypothetical protein